MTRVGDIVDPNETRGDLVARGYSESDATSAIAFAVWLRRGDLETGVLVGLITAQCAAIYQLSPPAGIFDPADLFRRAASRADGPEDVSPKEGTEPSGA